MPKLVLTTLSNSAQAAKFARGLIDEKLAACVSLIKIEASHYNWKGAPEKSAEVQLVIKTAHKKIPALEKFFKKHHPYELPEFLVLHASAGGAYGAWLRQSIK